MTGMGVIEENRWLAHQRDMRCCEGGARRGVSSGTAALS